MLFSFPLPGIKRCFAALCPIFIAVASVMAQSDVPGVKVNDDNTVTFTADFPSADEVWVKGSFVAEQEGAGSSDGKIRMGRDGNLWTCTTGVLPSELYTYQYEVDDNTIYDRANQDYYRDVADTLSFFIVPGGIADNYMQRNVRHGRVEKVWYPSSFENMSSRRMTVYFPPQYATERHRRFPVLYLLHGSGGDENSWSDAGRAVQILDNMIAAGCCEPMIVVMPNGNINLAAAPGEDPNNPAVEPSAMNASSMFGKIESTFMNEVVGYVDGHYRTVPDKAHRAIAGLSLGGLHTLFISLNNPDSFDYVGLFSAQTTNSLNDRRIDFMHKMGRTWNRLKNSIPFLGGSRMDNTINKLTTDELSIYSDVDDKLRTQFSNPPRLYYIAVGEDDFVKKLNDDWREKLDSLHCGYVYNETGGGHTWENWRRYLVDFLPRIFR